MRARISTLTLVAVIGVSWGCGPNVPFVPGGRDTGPPPVCASVTSARIVCVGEVAYTCDGTAPEATETVNCAASDRVCADGTGCLTCVPGRIRCDGETRERCLPDGSGFERLETCDAAAGLRCSRSGCADLCAEAATAESYIGCEYAPVTLSNDQLDPSFPFAIAIANPQLVQAAVAIDGGALDTPRTLSIPPGGLEVVELPWVMALHGPGDGSARSSTRVVGGAYRLRSDVPVTVTQFNPLEYQRGACTARECFSFTNDASLLLPTHVLTGSYLVASRATQHLTLGDNLFLSPGFVTLVGTSRTPVTVEIRTTAPTLPGEGIPALAAGTPHSFTLERGDVVQLLSDAPIGCTGPTRSEEGPDGTTATYCDLGAAYDLTGTEIRSDGPLAVFSGHDCTFVPYDRWACDHLEEQLFPVEALGRDLFVPITAPLRDDEPNVLRVVSAVDGNSVTFEPPLAEGEPPRVLSRGEFFEVELRSARWVRGTGPLLGALFLVGQDYGGIGTAGTTTTGPAVGDPAMALVVPNAQFRSEYAFLSPSTYSRNAATIVAPASARIELDGRFVTLTAVEGTGMGFAHVALVDGVHGASSTIPFGIYLAGFGSYTSYFVPGGMDFVPIGDPF